MEKKETKNKKINIKKVVSTVLVVATTVTAAGLTATLFRSNSSGKGSSSSDVNSDTSGVRVETFSDYDWNNISIANPDPEDGSGALVELTTVSNGEDEENTVLTMKKTGRSNTSQTVCLTSDEVVAEPGIQVVELDFMWMGCSNGVYGYQEGTYTWYYSLSMLTSSDSGSTSYLTLYLLKPWGSSSVYDVSLSSTGASDVVQLSVGEWTHLKMINDTINRTASVYVNDILVGTVDTSSLLANKGIALEVKNRGKVFGSTMHLDNFTAYMQ